MQGTWAGASWQSQATRRLHLVPRRSSYRATPVLPATVSLPKPLMQARSRAASKSPVLSPTPPTSLSPWQRATFLSQSCSTVLASFPAQSVRPARRKHRSFAVSSRATSTQKRMTPQLISSRVNTCIAVTALAPDSTLIHLIRARSRPQSASALTFLQPPSLGSAWRPCCKDGSFQGLNPSGGFPERSRKDQLKEKHIWQLFPAHSNRSPCSVSCSKPLAAAKSSPLPSDHRSADGATT